MSLFGSLFSAKAKEPNYPEVPDFSTVVTDIHSHLIPGIDDGVKTMEQSIDMIRAFSMLGFKKLVTTPHIMSDYFKNTPEIILSGLENVRAAVKKEGINIEIDAAAEYYLDENFLTKLKNERLLASSNDARIWEMKLVQAVAAPAWAYWALPAPSQATAIKNSLSSFTIISLQSLAS